MNILPIFKFISFQLFHLIENFLTLCGGGGGGGAITSELNKRLKSLPQEAVKEIRYYALTR